MKSPRSYRKRRGLLALLLALVLLLAACGGEQAPTPLPTELVQAATKVPPLPTDTPLSPSDTPAPPTDTSIPPTDTPTPPTDTPPPPTATPLPPTATPAPTETPPPTATAIPPTETPAPPTDTPPPTAVPVKAASPVPAPTKKPKAKNGKILFTSNRVSWDDVFVMNDDGTGVEQLTDMGKCYDACFTPDGKTIFFEHDDDIWKMNADGSGQTNLTNTEFKVEWFPVVAPDGKRVAFLFGWPGGFEIYTMKLDGTDQKPVTSGEFDLEPAWSRDGQKIAFSSLRGGNINIWVVNRDGSDVKQVTHFGPERLAMTPVFAPDGKQIAFSTITRGTAWEIWLVNLDGANPHKVVGTVGNDEGNSTDIVAWKKGKFLIAGWEGNWAPYFVPDSGGVPVPVLSSSYDDKASDWWLP